MKEKISCSLDGEVIELMDAVISKYPVIGSRSAFIDIAIRTFVSDIDELDWYYDNDYARNVIIELLERRCRRNAQTESENRNV